MEIRIGVTQTPKEIEIELDDASDREQLQRDVEKALTGDGMLWVTDRRGRKVGVPGAKVAYVEIGTPNEDRRVGFGAH